jgi:ribonuclease HII
MINVLISSFLVSMTMYFQYAKAFALSNSISNLLHRSNMSQALNLRRSKRLKTASSFVSSTTLERKHDHLLHVETTTKVVEQTQDDNDEDNKDDGVSHVEKTRKRPRKTSRRGLTNSREHTVLKTEPVTQNFLPHTREKELQSSTPNLQIMGIDEAGRGPLAGPVVAAAAIIPTDIPGVVDSKKLTKEQDREELYEKIISSPNARWAVAIGDARRIDEMNILQTTLECMRNAARGILNVPTLRREKMGVSTPSIRDEQVDESVNGLREVEASSRHDGCYIVCGINDEHGNQIDLNNMERVKQVTCGNHYALIDGNRCPKDMPCGAEFIIKGDSKEYAIAAASILAKVTRDRLMNEYDAIYPQYELKRHKGYPTSAHMDVVKQFGASPIHRRTFAPLKHMSFDDKGRIIVKEGVVDD